MVFGLATIAGIAHLAGFRWWELTPERVRAYVLSFGLWAPLIYFLAFAQPVVPLPASVMSMAGGLAFGLGGGLTTALSAATIRACGQFLIARFFGREAVKTLLRGRLASIDRRIGRRGFLTVLLIRITPNVPYDIQSFSLGCSRVPFHIFAMATFVALIPIILLWVYIGQNLTEPSQFWKIVVLLILVIVFWSLRTSSRKIRLRRAS
jgi:uncharacterized membrane protein YdjX (TVP38/TMEM64 family)